MKLSKREQVMLSGALIIAIAALFLVYYYMPVQSELKILKEQSDKLAYELESAKQTKILVESLEKQIENLQQQVEENHPDLLRVWDQPEVLVYLEEVIARLGIKEQVTFFDVIAAEDSVYEAGSVMLTLNTNYRALKRLLGELEQGRYFTTVQSLDIAAGPADGNPLRGYYTVGAGQEDLAIISENQKSLEVQLVLTFYSCGYEEEFPKEYHFLDGDYSKENIF